MVGTGMVDSGRRFGAVLRKRIRKDQPGWNRGKPLVPEGKKVSFVLFLSLFKNKTIWYLDAREAINERNYETA